ncbi:MAG: UV DNA damage repair endonuclease UvsE [Clostridiales bacterium]|nr:UV DNA damage repair endonuclease UvsE [Clostridiales bacterium]
MKIGYACLALAVPGSGMKSCALKNADADHLISLIGHNLDSLERLADYNIKNGISLFRISSDLIPFGSSAAAQLPWAEIYADKLKSTGNKMLGSGMRISMHPGQYTVLNSPDAEVTLRAAQDLDYHARVLDSLGAGEEHKIIIHLGGVYGDKKQAKSRFLSRYRELEPSVRKRLVLENDDKLFNIADVLETASAAGMPAVFDNLHNAVNPAGEITDEAGWIKLCAHTWKTSDGPPKIHYSQQSGEKKLGAHSESIEIDPFLEFLQQLPGTDTDIMLEVKDKNISALKCINCVSKRDIGALETEWARYKYFVLERSAKHYNAIRQLLKDKSEYPAVEMYRIIEEALNQPLLPGSALNAAEHVWSYFTNKASEARKNRFRSLLTKYSLGETGIQAVKNNLMLLAEKYDEQYLLNGYYLYK